MFLLVAFKFGLVVGANVITLIYNIVQWYNPLQHGYAYSDMYFEVSLLSCLAGELGLHGIDCWVNNRPLSLLHLFLCLP